MYRPSRLEGEARITARTRGTTPAELVPRIREIADEVAPGHVLAAIPMDARRGVEEPEVMLFLSLMVGLITLSVLLLSAAGISAMMSFAVTRRRREIGIRSALGAPRARIIWAIFSRSLRQLVVGVVVGTTVAGALDRLAGGELLGGQERILIPLIAVLMVLAGLLATCGPARRALRIQPMEALRQE